MSLPSLYDRLSAKLEGWFQELVVMLPNLAVAILAVLAFGLAARWVGKAVRATLLRVSGNEPISDLCGSLARLATVAVGVFAALSMLQLDRTLTSLLAGVGVVGLALGFAFQDIAANFMSGLIMALKRPFNVGDLIEIEGRKATVQRIELRATLVQTLDGLSILVPNKEIFQNAIINYTRTKSRRMDLSVGTAYCDDLEKVREVTMAAVRELEGRDLTRDVELFFEAFGDSSINFTLRVWLAESDEISYLNARSEAMIAIKKAYDREGITIPFPIRTLDFGAKVVGGERIDEMALQLVESDRAAE